MAFSKARPNAQLTPIFSQDLVTPGIFYFALLEPQDPTNITSWWIVLRCPQEVLPQPFKDSKDASSRAYPFFVPARGRFIWIERDNLYLLHASQKTAFAQTLLHNEFSDFYDLAVGVAKPDPLKYFERDIEEAGSRLLAMRTRFANRPQGGQVCSPSPAQVSSDHSPFFPEQEGSDDEEMEIVQHSTQRKRKRVPPASAATGNALSQPMLGRSILNPIHKSQTASTSQTRKSPVPATVARPVPPPVHHAPSIQSLPVRPRAFFTPLTHPEPKVYIKTEEEQYQVDYVQMANQDEIVQVFMGHMSKGFPTVRAAIEKSPVLAAQMQEDPRYGKFLMHPVLTQADLPDALAMLQFMQEGQYHPRSVRGNANNGPNALQGKTYQHEYNEEVIRAGRLYVLAKSFQVQGFAEHILDKLKRTQHFQYGNMAVMQCAILVFQEPGNIGRASRDGMETWLIKVIADKFKDIMKSEKEQRLFWEMEGRTAKRRVIRDIFALCAENYHNIGGIPIVIQDD